VRTCDMLEPVGRGSYRSDENYCGSLNWRCMIGEISSTSIHVDCTS
jgi:hypothetical protein